MSKDILNEIQQIHWWHRIELPLPNGTIITTPGDVDHCTDELATNRFGIPEKLTEKTILDVGCWDGYFSFLAEKRGALSVTSIDPYQGFTSPEIGQRGYKLAHTLLNSKCKFLITDLETYINNPQSSSADIVFYFGVLYHLDDPIKALRALYKVTNEFALIETAISQEVPRIANAWQFLPGNANDATNKWYPSLTGLAAALKYVGFSKVEIVFAHKRNPRATVKAIK